MENVEKKQQKPEADLDQKKLEITDSQLDSVLGFIEKVRKSINKHKSKLSIPRLIASSIEFVENIGGLTGKQKKALAVAIIGKIAKIYGLEPNEDLIDDSIEIMLDISRGKFNLKKTVGCCVSVVPKVFSKMLKK